MDHRRAEPERKAPRTPTHSRSGTRSATRPVTPKSDPATPRHPTESAEKKLQRELERRGTGTPARTEFPQLGPFNHHDVPLAPRYPQYLSRFDREGEATSSRMDFARAELSARRGRAGTYGDDFEVHGRSQTPYRRERPAGSVHRMESSPTRSTISRPEPPARGQVSKAARQYERLSRTERMERSTPTYAGSVRSERSSRGDLPEIRRKQRPVESGHQDSATLLGTGSGRPDSNTLGHTSTGYGGRGDQTFAMPPQSMAPPPARHRRRDDSDVFRLVDEAYRGAEEGHSQERSRHEQAIERERTYRKLEGEWQTQKDQNVLAFQHAGQRDAQIEGGEEQQVRATLYSEQSDEKSETRRERSIPGSLTRLSKFAEQIDTPEGAATGPTMEEEIPSSLIMSGRHSIRSARYRSMDLHSSLNSEQLEELLQNTVRREQPEEPEEYRQSTYMSDWNRLYAQTPAERSSSEALETATTGAENAEYAPADDQYEDEPPEAEEAHQRALPSDTDHGDSMLPVTSGGEATASQDSLAERAMEATIKYHEEHGHSWDARDMSQHPAFRVSRSHSRETTLTAFSAHLAFMYATITVIIALVIVRHALPETLVHTVRGTQRMTTKRHLKRAQS